MTGCLGDRALIRLSEDEGRPSERQHLATCQLCTSRAQALGRDVALVATVLRGDPPPALAPAVTVPVSWWVPAAALVGAVLLIVTWKVPASHDDAPLSITEVAQTTFAVEDSVESGVDRADLVALDDVLDASWDESEEQWP
jgi:hypothetical protein